jgi:predicted nucleic-acid-binding protein
MIALDTNILIRLFTRDDPAQVAAVERLLDQPRATFWIDDVAVLETVWVLDSSYGWPRDKIVAALNQLLGLPDTRFENRECMEQSVDAYAEGTDFVDALLVHRSLARGCDELASFDDAIPKHFQDFARKPK